MSLQNDRLHDNSVTPTSQVHASTILLLFIVGNLKRRNQGASTGIMPTPSFVKSNQVILIPFKGSHADINARTHTRTT
jgi:hypothetical protein